MIKPPQTPPMLFTQSRRLRLLEVKRSAIQCRKYANLAHVDPAQMADNPIALVDNRCKAWLDSVGFKASGFHSGPEQGAIQGLPFGYEERPNVDANSIVNELVAIGKVAPDAQDDVDWLKKNGVDPASVRAVEVPFPNMPDQLKAKRVDPVESLDPSAGALRANGK